MENLVHDEMVAQCADDDKYTAHGPPVQLSPLAAEVLTLAIHELATNSVKYGALGQSEGGVTVAWECSGTGEERRLTLTWRETGLQRGGAGAPGFGTELITERVPYELKGEGSLDVRDGTLTATIAFPLEAGSSILDTDTAPSVGVQV
jgi:two-component sensor histidine kinase